MATDTDTQLSEPAWLSWQLDATGRDVPKAADAELDGGYEQGLAALCAQLPIV